MVPAADVLLQDAGTTLRKLMRIDPVRLQRMLSFGEALAQVAMADGSVDTREREAMAASLQAQGVLSAVESELVVEFALANAGRWQASAQSEHDRTELAAALNAVAMADNHVSAQERDAIERVLRRGPDDAMEPDDA
ncbi:MAG: TerB family tellurite resistance protein [Pseudomonadota bacterium]